MSDTAERPGDNAAPDPETLARLVHENVITSFAVAGGYVPGSVVERRDGVALVASGLPIRLFNQVLIEADGASSAVVAAAVTVLRARGAPFAVDLRRGVDDRYLPLMAELGLVAMPERPWMPGMAIHPLSRDATWAQPAAGLEIRQATDGTGIADHVRAAADGFGAPVELMEAIVTEALLGYPGATVYAGYADGVPVVSGLGIRTGRTIGVYNVATVEAARRRGYGAAMTMRIVDDGAAAGCDTAILQASGMGQSVYERLGFRTVVEYDGYVDPASLPPGGAPA